MIKKKKEDEIESKLTYLPCKQSDNYNYSIQRKKPLLDNKCLKSCYVMQRLKLGASSKCFSDIYPISNKCKVNVFQFNTHAIALPHSSRVIKTYLLVFHFHETTLNSASGDSIEHTASRPTLISIPLEGSRIMNGF